jgi:tRNA threonylcarbamoyl adenosine modification protein (Sua5/YciO/YrdC/YwlC family)
MAVRLDEAVATLARGELVVYPTDTLMGLGARADRPEAVGRLLRAKERPPAQSISFAVSSYEEVERWAELTPERRAELRRRLPGPYTLLLPATPMARRALAPALLSPTGTVGIRIPDHPLARELARRAGPITCTSANRHGRPPARTEEEARRGLGDAIGAYVPARPAPSGVPSTLIDLTGATPRPVRRG